MKRLIAFLTLAYCASLSAQTYTTGHGGSYYYKIVINSSGFNGSVPLTRHYTSTRWGNITQNETANFQNGVAILREPTSGTYGVANGEWTHSWYYTCEAEHGSISSQAITHIETAAAPAAYNQELLLTLTFQPAGYEPETTDTYVSLDLQTDDPAMSASVRVVNGQGTLISSHQVYAPSAGVPHSYVGDLPFQVFSGETYHVQQLVGGEWVTLDTFNPIFFEGEWQGLPGPGDGYTVLIDNYPDPTPTPAPSPTPYISEPVPDTDPEPYLPSYSNPSTASNTLTAEDLDNLAQAVRKGTSDANGGEGGEDNGESLGTAEASAITSDDLESVVITDILNQAQGVNEEIEGILGQLEGVGNRLYTVFFRLSMSLTPITGKVDTLQVSIPPFGTLTLDAENYQFVRPWLLVVLMFLFLLAINNLFMRMGDT